MCTGSHLANREMYIWYTRMLIAFEVLPAFDSTRRPILEGPLECNANPSGVSIERKSFQTGFKIRDREKSAQWFEQTESATKHMVD